MTPGLCFAMRTDSHDDALLGEQVEDRLCDEARAEHQDPLERSESVQAAWLRGVGGVSHQDKLLLRRHCVEYSTD